MIEKEMFNMTERKENMVRGVANTKKSIIIIGIKEKNFHCTQRKGGKKTNESCEELSAEGK